MTEPKGRWSVLVTPAADDDFDQIVRWTTERFGGEQARNYARALSTAVDALSEGPATPGAKPRADIGAGCYAIHVARRGNRGRHFIVFRTGRDNADDVIEVLRILHDAMDLARHLPSDPDDA